MVKTRITDAGIIQEPGSGFEGSITVVNSRTRTASATVTSQDVGINILSASQGALTMTMPTAASAPGNLFIFRSTSPSAHVITSSQDTGNVIVHGIIGGAINVTGVNASKVTFPAVAGSSLLLISDGANWVVHGGSGSMTFAKGAA